MKNFDGTKINGAKIKIKKGIVLVSEHEGINIQLNAEIFLRKTAR